MAVREQAARHRRRLGLQGSRNAAGVAAPSGERPLGGRPLAGRVRRARCLAGAGRDLQRGACARTRAADPRARGRKPRRPDADGARDRPTEAAVAVEDPRGGAHLVPALQRTGRRERPRRAVDQGREARRYLLRERAESVVLVREVRRFRDRVGAHRSGRAQAQGDLDARPSDERAGRRCAAAQADHRRVRVQRGLLRRGARGGGEPHRHRERRLARRRYDPCERARYQLRLEGAGPARGRARDAVEARRRAR